MKVLDAIASGLSYVDGLRAIDSAGPSVNAQAFLDHLASHGFVVRARDGAERFRTAPSTLDAKNVSATALRAMRQKAGLSRAALATRAGVSADTIDAWEKGRKCPQDAKLAAVLDALAQANVSDAEGR